MIKLYTNREEALSYWKQSYPQLQCDYLLTIEPKVDSDNYNKVAPIVDFQIPDTGIDFNYLDSMLGHITPQIKLGPFPITFLASKDIQQVDYWPNETSSLNPNFSEILPVQNMSLFNLWSTQYKRNGAFAFIPVAQRPTVKISRLNESDTPTPIVEAYCCMFTYPKAQLNFASSDACKYTMNVFYEDIKINV